MKSEPALDYLAQCYFHQDYDLEADSPIGVIRKFRTAESGERVAALRTAVRVILDSGAPEETMAAIWLTGAGASYDPRSDGITVSQWFRTIVAELPEVRQAAGLGRRRIAETGSRTERNH